VEIKTWHAYRSNCKLIESNQDSSMAKPVAASFLTQANALFKKNLTYQVWPNNIHALSIYTWTKCNYILLPLL